MPSDDREQNFENALARHLRAGASSQTQPPACGDAEILAAYHQRSLPADEMASLQPHVQSCERCRQVLAHLAATDDIPAGAIGATPLSLAPHQPNLRVITAHRLLRWRWVAPAGALAAALLVWVAVRENTAVPPVQGPVLVAKRSEGAKEQLPSSPPTPAPSLNATRPQENASSDSISALHSAQPSQIAAAPKTHPQSLSKQKDFREAPKNGSAADDSREFALASKNPAKPPSSQRDRNRSIPGAVTETVTVEPAPAGLARNDLPESEAERKTASKDKSLSVPSPKPALPSGVAGGAPAAARGQSVQPLQSAAEAADVSDAGLQQQPMAGKSRFEQKAEMRLANASAEVTISVPGVRVSWRVGQAGVIQFSSDAGKTWTLQHSGVITDLLAGSAPSGQVCWIVGRAGTILRTTDAGLHWQKVRPPTPDDLRSVFAVDAQQATIGDAYETTDGGATWHKLNPQ